MTIEETVAVHTERINGLERVLGHLLDRRTKEAKEEFWALAANNSLQDINPDSIIRHKDGRAAARRRLGGDS